MEMEMKLVEGDPEVIVPLGLIKAARSQAGPETLLTLILWNSRPVHKTSRTFCQPRDLGLNFCHAVPHAGSHSCGGMDPDTETRLRDQYLVSSCYVPIAEEV